MQDKEFPKRKNLRLKDFDYSSNNCCFVTNCTKGKEHLLSHIKNVGAGFHARPKEIIKTPFGFDVEKTLFFIANKYHITVDNYIIMPNHIHLLLTMDNNGFEIASGGHGRGCERRPVDEISEQNEIKKQRAMRRNEQCDYVFEGVPSLPDIIGQFKSYTTKLYREKIGESKTVLWQRGYYDHIVRNQEDFHNIWNYVENNALKEYANTEGEAT